MKNQTQVGRKSKAAPVSAQSQSRTRRIKFLVDAEGKRKIEAAAKRSKMSVSKFAEAAIRDVLPKGRKAVATEQGIIIRRTARAMPVGR